MGENFGRYQLVERIALGGFAEIFKAHAVGIAGFEKTLANKRLHPRYSQDSDFIAWMVDEAKITSQLSHTNICQVLDFAKVEGHYFMAMEYISGRDVYRIMKKLRETKDPAPIELVAFIGREACAGLDYTHRKRDAEGHALDIVHRDMSPQNVMVSLDGDIKIIDFGIAKSRARGYETEAGIIKGKFFYMSPEQARGEELDSRTDVFSLGIVLWELVTGELLYKDDDEVTLLSQVRRAVIRPPKEIRPDIPDALNRIIMKALARSRDERYASAFEMQKELERFLVRYNSKYGKDQVGYWMRSTFYEELPAKEVQNLDSFRHRADFLADEHSLIGQGIHTEDKTKPQTGEESSLMEIGSDVLESLDELTSSSVVVSQGVGAGEEFFDDAVTAAVDGLSDETGGTPAAIPRVSRGAEPLSSDYGAGHQPVEVQEPSSSIKIESVQGAPWEQKATFEHLPTELGEQVKTPSTDQVRQASNAMRQRPPVSAYQKANMMERAQQTLSPLVNNVSSKLSGRIGQDRIYMGLILLLIMGGAIALTAHLNKKERLGVSASSSQSDSKVALDNCREFVMRDGKKVCAGSDSATTASLSTLVIQTNPSGASVFVNENRLPGKTPTSAKYEPKSQVRLTLSLPDYQTINETVQLPGPGETFKIERTLEKPFGTLVVTSQPAGAKITVDREYKGRTPDTITNLRLDRAQVVRIEKQGYEPQTRSVSWANTGKSIEQNLLFTLNRVQAPVKRKPKRVRRKSRRTPRKRAKPAPRRKRFEEDAEPRRREVSRRKGRLRVQTRPWSTVFLDGRSIGEAPTVESVLEGNYRLKVCFEGDRSRCVVRRIRVNGNGETTERFRE